MRVRQLQAFLAVAETGSFQAAARQCGVTQSTVSRQIQSLEDADFGIPVAPVVIRQRADFQNAAIQGLGVTEISKKTKAAKEILSLWKWLKGEVNA